MVGLAGNRASSAPIELGLGLSLAIVKYLENLRTNHSHLSEEQCVYLSRGLKSNSRLKYLDLGAQQNIGLLPSESLKSLMSQNLKR